MPLEAAGNAFARGTWYARTRIATGKHHGSPMPWCGSRKPAATRARVVAELAGELRALSTAAEMIPRSLNRAAAATTPAELDAVLELVKRMTTDAYSPAVARGQALSTFADVANAWVGGKLARDFPDHVKAKRSIRGDSQRLTKHMYPSSGGRRAHSRSSTPSVS